MTRQSRYLDPARPIPSGLDWYVITTEPAREDVIARWLEEQGYFTLTPLETRWRLAKPRCGGKSRKREAYQVPLLPRMVLVGFAEPPRWLAVMDRYGITGVLGINGAPVPMRRGEAERLQQASERLRRQSGPRAVKAGSKARIAAPGLFLGHVVEVRSITGKTARIVQQLFGAAREVEIALDDLDAA